MHDGTSAPQTITPHTGSLWRLRSIQFLALYTLFGFTGFFATLSALPAWMADQGTSAGIAGLLTTVLLVSTVSTQTLVPKMLDVFGMTPVLTAGALALGAPSLLLLSGNDLAVILPVCVVRGIGFGIVTVLGSTLTARLVPPARRGEAVGIYGLAIALPNLFAVAGGVALVTADRFVVVAVLGAVPILGVLVAGPLAHLAGRDPDAARTTASPAEDAASVRADDGSAARASRRVARRAALGPSLVLMVVTLVSGGFMTYLPIERPSGMLATVGLFVWGAFGAYARWQAGLVADRSGLRLLLPGASVVSVVGIGVVVAGLSMGGTSSVVLTLLGAAILGLGFGATQNVTMVAAFARARERETAAVSSVWNAGFDTGTAAGAGLVGALTVVMTIPPALALTAVLIVVSIPLAIRSARPPSRG